METLINSLCAAFRRDYYFTRRRDARAPVSDTSTSVKLPFTTYFYGYARKTY
jgi:hypothetical protein